MRAGCKDCDKTKRAVVASWTTLDVDARDALPEGANRFGCASALRGCGRLECGARPGKQCGLVAVGEQPVVADAVEAARQHVQSKAAQKLDGLELHDSAPLAVGVVLVAKAH